MYLHLYLYSICNYFCWFTRNAVTAEWTPPGLEALLDYFDGSYVSGTSRSTRLQTTAPGAVPRLKIRRVPPVFPPATWNVYCETLSGQDRTNNLCEGWNHGFAQLVGHSHPSVWRLIEALQQECIFASTAIYQDGLGQPPKKRVKRATKDLEERLLNLCRRRRENSKTIEELLRGIAHTIRLLRQTLLTIYNITIFYYILQKQ